MTLSSSRRQFLTTAGVALAGAGRIGTASAAETTTISGQITAESGAGIVNDEIEISGAGDFTGTRTDSSGYFEKEVPVDNTYRLAFYKADSSSDFEAVKNGAPHIYFLGYHSVGDSPTDIGTIELPRAHIVDFRVLKPNGEPLLGSSPDFRHNGWGANGSRLAIDTEGFTVIKGASFTGAEFASNVTLEVEPPVGDEYESQKYTRQITVDEPMTATVIIDADGAKWDVQTTASFNGATPTKTSTVESTTVETPTTTTEPATTSPTTASTTRSKPTEQSTTTARNTTQSSTTTTSRGFLSNDGPDADVSVLTDPLYLTVGGFVLSVSGIAHQMLRGY